jgi:hypothetical protein
LLYFASPPTSPPPDEIQFSLSVSDFLSRSASTHRTIRVNVDLEQLSDAIYKCWRLFLNSQLSPGQSGSMSASRLMQLGESDKPERYRPVGTTRKVVGLGYDTVVDKRVNGIRGMHIARQTVPNNLRHILATRTSSICSNGITAINPSIIECPAGRLV